MVEARISLEEFFAREPETPRHTGCGSCGNGDAASRCGNGLEKIYPTTAVRFGYMRYIGEFSHPPDMRFTCGARVVIQTDRGMEIGEQVSLTCGGCSKSVTRDQMRSWVQACGEDAFIFNAGRIIREATAADLAENALIVARNRVRGDLCQRLADKHKLPIRIVDCETIFGGERILFYFRSDERVDFRSLVRDLAQEYHTRIEMRQVGARDEARLLADFETCGREVCCKVFLKTLRPVSMKMAKLQKASLDPSKVSGRCGRLKCCLRYEHVAYTELDARLPRLGVRIRTNHGDGVVVNRQILTQLVQIRKDDESLVTVVIEDVVGHDGGAQRPTSAGGGSERRRSGQKADLSIVDAPPDMPEEDDDPESFGAGLTEEPDEAPSESPRFRQPPRSGSRGTHSGSHPPRESERSQLPKPESQPRSKSKPGSGPSAPNREGGRRGGSASGDARARGRGEGQPRPPRKPHSDQSQPRVPNSDTPQPGQSGRTEGDDPASDVVRDQTDSSSAEQGTHESTMQGIDPTAQSTGESRGRRMRRRFRRRRDGRQGGSGAAPPDAPA